VSENGFQKYQEFLDALPGQVVLDQIRTVDKTRLGRIDKQTQVEVLSVLSEIFAP
jgi:mRNA-degrading endonuclease toxin of MazEF toxin-antitoxin module